jgi:hypothetical protein
MMKTFSIFILAISFTLGGVWTALAQGKDPGNLYSTWLRLSLSGKNQVEIEYYMRHVKTNDLDKVKERLRFYVIDNLKRQGVSTMITQSIDQDDMRVAMKKVRTEVRFAGMEYDELLRMKIKEEFGILLADL